MFKNDQEQKVKTFVRPFPCSHSLNHVLTLSEAPSTRLRALLFHGNQCPALLEDPCSAKKSGHQLVPWGKKIKTQPTSLNPDLSKHTAQLHQNKGSWGALVQKAQRCPTSGDRSGLWTQKDAETSLQNGVRCLLFRILYHQGRGTYFASLWLPIPPMNAGMAPGRCDHCRGISPCAERKP